MDSKHLDDLLERIEASDPDDVRQQTAILMHLCDLREDLERSGGGPLAGYLDAASLLTQYLTRMQDQGPQGLLRITSRILRLVRDQVSEELSRRAADGRSEVPAAVPCEPPRPAVGPLAPAGEPAVEYPAPPLPSPREIPTPKDLRLVSDVFLGEILIQQGMVTSRQVSKALELQRSRGMLLGAALIQIGAATAKQIETGLRVQKGLRATSAGRGRRRPGAPAWEASIELCGVSDLLLGETLVRLGYITRRNLDKGLERQRGTKLRIGEALIELGVVTWSEIEHALELQSEGSSSYVR